MRKGPILASVEGRSNLPSAAPLEGWIDSRRPQTRQETHVLVEVTQPGACESALPRPQYVRVPLHRPILSGEHIGASRLDEHRIRFATRQSGLVCRSVGTQMRRMWTWLSIARVAH